MKHILKSVTKVTNYSHLNMYIANYNLPNQKVLNYQLATRRKENELSINTGKHTVADAVKILPYTLINGEISIVFIKEFRHAIGDYIFSVPAGLVENNEDPKEAAVRELMEEIGATVNEIKLSEPNSYISVGMSDESMECYIANVTINSTAQLTDHEDITTRLVPLSQLNEFLNANLLDLQTRLLTKLFYLENN